MDAAVVDTINRRDAYRIANHLDLLDWFNGILGDKTPEVGPPWFRRKASDALMSDDETQRTDRVWLVSVLAARTPDVAFDGAPADCDWDNLFSHLRSEILARRDPESPHAGTAETQRRVVV